MLSARTFRLILLAAAGLASPNALAQPRQLLINGKAFDEKECQQLSLLKTLSVPKIKEDSIGVELSLAHDNLGLGAKGFTSIAAFNSFDLVSWLQSEKSVGDGTLHNINLDDNGDSFTKSKARDGSRILIYMFSYKKRSKKSRIFQVHFCN